MRQLIWLACWLLRRRRSTSSTRRPTRFISFHHPAPASPTRSRAREPFCLKNQLHTRLTALHPSFCEACAWSMPWAPHCRLVIFRTSRSITARFLTRAQTGFSCKGAIRHCQAARSSTSGAMLLSWPAVTSRHSHPATCWCTTTAFIGLRA